MGVEGHVIESTKADLHAVRSATVSPQPQVPVRGHRDALRAHDLVPSARQEGHEESADAIVRMAPHLEGHGLGAEEVDAEDVVDWVLDGPQSAGHLHGCGGVGPRDVQHRLESEHEVLGAIGVDRLGIQDVWT